MHYSLLCIYIYTYILSSSRKPSGLSFYGLRRRHHPTFLFMASVVVCFRRRRKLLFYGFRRWFSFMVSVVAGKRCLYGFRRRIFDGFCRRRRIQNFRTYRVIPRFLSFWTGFRRCFFCYGFRRGRKTFCMVSVVGFLMVSVVARNVSLWFPSLVFFNGFRLLQDRGSPSDGNHKQTIRTFP